MELPKAFVMYLPFGTPPEKIEKLEHWGSARFRNFKVSEQPDRDLVVAGGFFDPLRAPASLKAFQRLVGNNLSNWGVERPHYERGWLQYVTPKAWYLELTTRAEREAEARGLVAQATTKALRTARRLEDERQAKVCRAVQALQRLVDRRTKVGFDALAEKVQERRDAQAAVREAKKRVFNAERFDLPELPVDYAEEELDTCQTWQEVKRRRVEHPQPAWKDREDARLARAARERQVSERAIALFRAPRG